MVENPGGITQAMRNQLSHLQARFATHKPLKSFLRLKNSLLKTGSTRS
jgi:hypothetical protein